MAATVAMAAESLASAPLAERWFHLARNPLTPEDTQFCVDKISTAGRHGYTAMLWAVNMDNYPGRPDWWKRNFLRIRQACADNKIEIVPMIWSVGYGTMLGRNPNLAEGFPVTDVPYVVGDDRVARIAADTEELLRNGSFEESGKDGALSGWKMLDKPGVKTFVDEEVFHSGRRSVRMERFSEFSVDGDCRIIQKLALKPWSQYECSMWVKTENFTAPSSFAISFYDADGCLARQPVIHRRPTTLPWTHVSVPLQTKSRGDVTIYAGTYRGKDGKIWMDDFTIRPKGLPDVLRRPGCPFVVKSAKTLQVYDEGADYEPVPGLSRGRRPAAQPGSSLEIRLTKGSRIMPGERLLVSAYRKTAVKGGSQVCVCMSEPELYSHFRTCAGELWGLIAPKRWALSMDEVRMGGTCAACRARHTDMAHIIGDCVTKQCEIIRGVCPDAKIYIWADMFDPKHNAVPRYMLCEGSFVDSWRYVPKDLVFMCWYGSRMKEQLGFFSGLGFRTLCASYYDAPDLGSCRRHLKEAKETPGCEGIMYTTFVPRYELLGAFGDMAAERDGTAAPAANAAAATPAAPARAVEAKATAAKIVGDDLYDVAKSPIRNLDAWRRAVDAESGVVICATPVPRGLKRDSEAWRASRAVAEEVFKLADNKRILYLDVRPAFYGKDGVKPEFYEADGLSLNKAGRARLEKLYKPLLDWAASGSTNPPPATKYGYKGANTSRIHFKRKTKSGEERWWWDRVMEKMEQRDRICREDGGRLDVLFIGDSMTHRWEWADSGAPVYERLCRGRSVMNMAIGGDGRRSQRWLIDNGLIAGLQAKLVSICLGGNDHNYKWSDDSPAAVAKGVGEIVDIIRRQMPDAKILVMPINCRLTGNPEHAEWWKNDVQTNRLIEKIADGKRVFFLDIGEPLRRAFGNEAKMAKELTTDGTHLSRKMFEHWYRLLEPYLPEAGRR